MELLQETRDLMGYDRKLKNVVAKSFIDMLDRHCIEIKFKPLSEKTQAEKDILEISTIIPSDSHVRSLVLTHQQFLTIHPISGNDG